MRLSTLFYKTRSDLIKQVNLTLFKKYDDLLKVKCRRLDHWTIKTYHRICLERLNLTKTQYSILDYAQVNGTPISNPKTRCVGCGFGRLSITNSLRESKITLNKAKENYQWKKMVSKEFKKLILNPPDTIYISSSTVYEPCTTLITSRLENCTCGQPHGNHWDGKPHWDDISFRFKLDFLDSIKTQCRFANLWILTVVTVKNFNEEDKLYRLENSTKDFFDKEIVIPVKYLTKEIVVSAVRKWVSKNIPQLAHVQIEWGKYDV